MSYLNFPFFALHFLECARENVFKSGMYSRTQFSSACLSICTGIGLFSNPLNSNNFLMVSQFQSCSSLSWTWKKPCFVMFVQPSLLQVKNHHNWVVGRYSKAWPSLSASMAAPAAVWSQSIFHSNHPLHNPIHFNYLTPFSRQCPLYVVILFESEVSDGVSFWVIYSFFGKL